MIELTRKISASSRISMVPFPSMSYSLKARSRISSGLPRSVTDTACSVPTSNTRHCKFSTFSAVETPCIRTRSAHQKCTVSEVIGRNSKFSASRRNIKDRRGNGRIWRRTADGCNQFFQTGPETARPLGLRFLGGQGPHKNLI